MIAYSVFQNYLKTKPTLYEVPEWSDFVYAMSGLCVSRDATNHTKKYGTPAISPAVYAPEAVRGNANVLSWGGWIAIDVDNDLLDVPASVAIEHLEAKGLDYLVYGSTKCTKAVNRYRIVLPLSRHLSADEAQGVWKAVTQYFCELGPDASCKDISRIYGAPSHWQAHPDGNTDPYNIFEFKIDGVPLDVELVLQAYHPPVEPVAAPYVPPKVTEWTGPTRVSSGELKNLPDGHSLWASPVINNRFVIDYFSLAKGEHHSGMYLFMTRMIGRAKAKGYHISETDILQYCRELDNSSPIKTSSERWSRMPYEIARAFRFCA